MGDVCAILAAKSGQPMEWLLAAIRADRELFDSLWYACFPPEPAGPGNCDVDQILAGKA